MKPAIPHIEVHHFREAHPILPVVNCGTRQSARIGYKSGQADTYQLHGEKQFMSERLQTSPLPVRAGPLNP
jgi:hypothetical protein